MLILALLCLFAAVADCEESGWKTGNLYKYDFSGCFYMDEPIREYVKANVYIQPISSDKLSVIAQNVRAGKVNGTECSPPEEQLLKSDKESNIDEPFEINLKNGLAQSLTVNQNVSNSQLSVVKIIVNQLQVNLQGDAKPNPAYKVKENSIIGECETQYEVSPLSEDSLQKEFNLPPLPKDHGELFKVVKTTDQTKCQKNTTEELLAKDITSMTNTNSMVISGSVKEPTIQQSVSTNKMVFKPPTPQAQPPTLMSVTNLTLTATDPAKEPPRKVTNPREVNLAFYPEQRD